MRHQVLTIPLLLLLFVPGSAQSVRADKHKELASIVETMKSLIKFNQNGRGRNTIFVSDIVKNGAGQFAYAYWKEDSSITILHLPLSLPVEKNSGDYYWLTMKARIDLTTDVVPTERDIGGSSFLVDRKWVNNIIRRCKNGVRLRL